jgi:hypothetical protein
MMELSLHLGGTLQGLSRTMSEAEFQAWGIYAYKRMLPFRRLEVYLAQLTLWVARSAGYSGMGVQDFLLDTRLEAVEDEPEGEPTVAEAQNVFEFQPKYRKKR